MKPTGEFWAAVRLVAFANMRPTQGDWLTLYDIDRRAIDGRDTGESRDRLIEAQQLADKIGLRVARPIPARNPMPAGGGELWQQFVAGVREYGEPPPLTPVLCRGDYARMMAWSFPGPWDERWFARHLRLSVAAVERLGTKWSRAVQQLHRETRRRLEMVCTPGADLTSFVRKLERHRLPGQHLRAADPRGRLTKESLFRLVPDQKPQTLAEELDEVFVRIVVSGLWHRIYRCERCRRFRVDRLRRDSRSRPASRFCPKGDCRRNQWRAERRGERLQQRSDILAYMQTLRGGGVVDPYEAARKKFGLSRRTFESLRRMRVKGESEAAPTPVGVRRFPR